ncbi:hypothetical protein CJU89_6332 [Yarrowia sp. B02]|nr:hypothetical protein CJU89_6332 [Yarrowia sp. B02]
MNMYFLRKFDEHKRSWEELNEELGEEAQYTVESMKNIVWRNDPNRDDLEDAIRMGETMIDDQEENGMGYMVYDDGGGDDREPYPEYSDDEYY